MYDSHVYYEDFDEFKGIVEDIVNGDADDYDVEDIAANIQDLYDNGEMSTEQYDELMGYLQEM